LLRKQRKTLGGYFFCRTLYKCKATYFQQKQRRGQVTEECQLAEVTQSKNDE